MSPEDVEAEYGQLPDEIRRRVDDGLPGSPTAVKLMVGNALADQESLAEHAATSAGREGMRSGQVSEFTMIANLKPDGAARLRRLFDLVGNSLSFAGQIGTLHDMRFVLLDNDTKLLFATTYDGDLDPYLDEFAIRVPEMMDYLLGAIDGWPGVRTPGSKALLAEAQHPAIGWFVAHPNLTVAEESRLLALDENVNSFVEKLN